MHGTQTRDFTYVRDVVEAIRCAVGSDLSCAVLNVGSGNEYSVNRLVELLEANEVVHLPKRPGEPDRTRADITQIGRLLNFVPKVSFEEGVSLMLENIEHWRDAPVWTEDAIAEATQTWFKCLK